MNTKNIGITCAVLGTTFLLAGVAEMLAFAGAVTSEAPTLSGDFFTGFVLLTIGAVFLTGVPKARKGESRSVAYLYSGLLLGLGLLAVGAFYTLADFVGTAVVEGQPWSPRVPLYLLLGVVSGLIYIPVRKGVREWTG